MADGTPTSKDRHLWEKAAAKSLKGESPDLLAWRTPEGLTVKPLYTAADLESLRYTDTLPGLEPFEELRMRTR